MQLDHNGNPAEYLGDAVYAAFDKQTGMVELRTDAHYAPVKVYLEPAVYRNLVKFVTTVNPSINE